MVDTVLSLDEAKDPEIKNIWYPLGIITFYAPVLEAAHTFISTMGRLKYLTPVY